MVKKYNKYNYLTSTSTSAEQSPKELIKLLKDGNNRFVNNKVFNQNLNEILKETCEGQDPKISIVGCIDSRVPHEIIFDLHKGDIFSIRIAGNIINDDILGSLEFSSGVKNVTLIVVLGHSKCGAVMAAMNKSSVPKKFGELHKLIRKVKLNDNDVNTNIKHNVENSVQEIKSHLLKKNIIKNENIIVIGAIYDVCTGKVQFIEEE